MTKPVFDPEQSKTAEIIEKATAADADTEDQLLALQHMADRRRKDPDLERRYAALRDRMADQLKSEGPRYFIDDAGVKRYAYVIAPENLEVDVNEIVALHAQGKLPELDLERAFPREPNREYLRHAIATGKIPAAVVAKTMRFTPGTARVSFASDSDRDER